MVVLFSYDIRCVHMYVCVCVSMCVYACVPTHNLIDCMYLMLDRLRVQMPYCHSAAVLVVRYTITLLD